MCEESPDDMERLTAGLRSPVTRPGAAEPQDARWGAGRRRFVAGVSLLWVVAAVVGMLVTQGRSAGRSRSAATAAVGPQDELLTQDVQSKFNLDLEFKEKVVAEAKEAFEQAIEQEKDAKIQEIVKILEGRVVTSLGKQIDKKLPLELEPSGLGIMPRYFDRTCVRGSLGPGEQVLLFYHDDDMVDDIPNTAEEIAAGFQNDNAAFVGNRRLQSMRLTGVRMCLEESHAPGSDCKRICYKAVEGDWSYDGPGIAAGMANDWQKLTYALSGQIDNGLPGQGTHGNFVEALLRDRHCLSTNKSDSPMYCWMCPAKYDHGAAGKMGQWARESGNWHVWGYGMTLDRTSIGDELRWQDKECNDNAGPWDTFYVVGEVEQEPTSTPSPIVPTTTTPPTTTTLAPATTLPPTTTAGQSTSLFCFSVMNIHNYELGMMRSQLSTGAGIFGCEGWSVFSDEKTWLSPGPPVRIENTVLNIKVQAKTGVSTHFLNTDVFATAWNMIRQEGKYKQHGWTVKVDPDAVFFPARLREHVRTVPYFPNGVYVLNCLFTDHKFWFFGAIEVISTKAVDAYFAGSDVCMRELDRGELGEDTWLRKCLDKLHVSNTQDTGLLSDGYCNEAPSPCVSGKVTFHPFKSPDAYFQCYKEAMQSGAEGR